MIDERRDDWRHGVDENLASLNAGQRVWERENHLIRKLLTEQDHLLRGDAEKETDGLIARMHHLENEINLLKAVVLKDKAGNNGLAGRVELLETRERTSGHRWQFVTALVVAVLSLIGVIVTSWPQIWATLNRKRTDPLGQMIEKVKNPKPRYHRVVIREEPEDSE